MQLSRFPPLQSQQGFSGTVRRGLAPCWGSALKEGGLQDPLLLCRSLQPQRVRGAEADRHQQEIFHQLQAVVPEEDLWEVHVSPWVPDRVSPKALWRWVLGGRSRQQLWDVRAHGVGVTCVCVKNCFSFLPPEKYLFF